MGKTSSDLLGWLVVGIMVSVLLVVLLICPADILTANVQTLMASAETEGTILSCCVIPHRSRPDSSTTYGIEVSYEYTVQGKRMTGTRLAPGFLNFITGQDGYETAQKYPVNSKVVVHYNPRRPMFAFIEQGVLSLSVGISLICIGITVLGWLKQFRPNRIFPRAVSALLYALFPAGFITVFIMPRYCDASVFLGKAYIYGGLYLGIYLILLFKARKSIASTGAVQENWSATKLNDEQAKFNEDKPSTPITQLKSKKDVVRFFTHDTGDKPLAVFLADVVEHIGRDGYVDVDRGGSGQPYAVEYQKCPEDPRKSLEIQSEYQSLKRELAGAQNGSDRDRVERQIASFAGGLCTIRINVMTSDEFNRQRKLVIDAWGKFKEVTKDMK